MDKIKTRTDVEKAIRDADINRLVDYFRFNNENLTKEIAAFIKLKGCADENDILLDFDNQTYQIQVLINCHGALIELEQTEQTI